MSAERQEALTDKPIPTLDEWLGDGPRADGFESWVREMLRGERKDFLDDKLEAAMRVSRTMGVAVIETLRTECETYGREDVETLLIVARSVASVITVALMSRLDEDKNPPVRKIGGMISEEMRHSIALTVDRILRNDKARKKESRPS